MLRQQYHFGPGRFAAYSTVSPGDDCLLERGANLAPFTRSRRLKAEVRERGCGFESG